VELLRHKATVWNLELSCSNVTPIQGLELDNMVTIPKPGEGDPTKRKKPLEPRIVEKVREKLKKASYGIAGRSARDLFRQIDTDGSGQLDDGEFRQAIRSVLGIPIYSISDAEISGLCGMLDTDASGELSIDEILDFIGEEPEEGDSKGTNSSRFSQIWPEVRKSAGYVQKEKRLSAPETPSGASIGSATVTPRGTVYQRGRLLTGRSSGSGLPALSNPQTPGGLDLSTSSSVKLPAMFGVPGG